MRALILAAVTTLAISACNGSDTAENAVNVGDNVAAEDIVANDTTAIDAATNEAANMAEESEVSLPPVGGDDSADDSDRPSRRPAPRTEREPVENATSNTPAASNTVANAQ